jgi:hypothetical protein
MSKAIEVPLRDQSGAEIGVVVKLSADGEIEGWSSPFEVDGRPYPFSKARAAALLARFTHFATQIAEAAELAAPQPKKDDPK